PTLYLGRGDVRTRQKSNNAVRKASLKLQNAGVGNVYCDSDAESPGQPQLALLETKLGASCCVADDAPSSISHVASLNEGVRSAVQFSSITREVPRPSSIKPPDRDEELHRPPFGLVAG